MIKIYTKGVANANNRCGAYAYAITVDDVLYCGDSEWYTNTTSNRMELQAILNGILAAPSSEEPITVITENNYAGSFARNFDDATSNLDILQEIQAALNDKDVIVKHPSGSIDRKFISICTDSAKVMYNIVKTTHSNFTEYFKVKGNID